MYKKLFKHFNSQEIKDFDAHIEKFKPVLQEIKSREVNVEKNMLNTFIEISKNTNNIDGSNSKERLDYIKTKLLDPKILDSQQSYAASEFVDAVDKQAQLLGNHRSFKPSVDSVIMELKPLLSDAETVKKLKSSALSNSYMKLADDKYFNREVVKPISNFLDVRDLEVLNQILNSSEYCEALCHAVLDNKVCLIIGAKAFVYYAYNIYGQEEQFIHFIKEVKTSVYNKYTTFEKVQSVFYTFRGPIFALGAGVLSTMIWRNFPTFMWQNYLKDYLLSLVLGNNPEVPKIAPVPSDIDIKPETPSVYKAPEYQFPNKILESGVKQTKDNIKATIYHSLDTAASSRKILWDTVLTPALMDLGLIENENDKMSKEIEKNRDSIKEVVKEAVKEVLQDSVKEVVEDSLFKRKK